jgi:hypothetical protein
MNKSQKTTWNFHSDADLTAAGYTRKGGGRCTAANCRIQVAWWITPQGKWMLIDVFGSKPHWATCKDAKQFRRAKAKKEVRK